MSNSLIEKKLIADVIILIFNNLDFYSQKNLKLTSKFFGNYSITNLFDETIREKLTSKILKIYPNVIKLDITGNQYIYEINDLIKLKILHINDIFYPAIQGGDNFELRCKINNDGISRLTNLTELSIDNNKLINDLNKLVNLQKISAYSDCAITCKGFSKLTNLTELCVPFNRNIIQINSLINLTKLDASGDCGINSNGIFELINLTELYADGNKNIIDINNLINLKKLSIASLHSYTYDHDYLRNESGATNNGISKLTNLTWLNINSNSKITEINNLINLKTLSAANIYNNFEWWGLSGITNNSINKLSNLTKLNIDNNSNMTNLNSLFNLKKLSIANDFISYDEYDYCQISKLVITYDGISSLRNLTKIIISGNKNISIKELTRLTNLSNIRNDIFLSNSNIYFSDDDI